MSIDFAPTVIPVTPSTTRRLEPAQDVKSSYDGSNVVFRLLRMETWGPALMNLGFYQFRSPFGFLNLFANQELAQRRLVMKAVDLLQIEPGNRLLDIACGRGKSSFIVSCMHPQAEIVGIDLLEQNVRVAETLFDQVDNLSYQSGNAMSLDFPDASFDRVMCLEAAFHFPDRAQFLQEASRVLRPGGKLIVVDFAWNNDEQRVHRNDPETRLVRHIWQYDDMFSISDYLHHAHEAGLKSLVHLNWSRNVTSPIQYQFEFLSSLGNNPIGRRFLEWRNPLYRSFNLQDWKEVARAARAHRHVQQFSKYIAFVFEKPMENSQ